MECDLSISSGDRSGVKRKAPWRAIRYSAPRCRRPFSIILTSLTRWRTRSASGSAGVRRIAQRFARLARDAFAASPDLIDAASRDLQSIAVHDPATTALLPPLLNFKGYVALQAWRVSNWLWRQRRNDLALLLQSLSSDQLQVCIHPSASIGTSVFLDHATGIIIGAFAVIGDEVTILQNVTIGRKQFGAGPRARKSAGAFISAPDRPLSATSASAISPRSAPARSSSMMCRPAAPRSAFPRG